MIPESVVSVDQALATLNERFAPARKSRRWLVEFLFRTKTTAAGLPLYRTAGRDKLVYVDRVIEAFKCPSGSLRTARKRGRGIITSADPISESDLIEAARLTGDQSLLPSLKSWNDRSSAENTRPRKRPHLATNNG